MNRRRRAILMLLAAVAAGLLAVAVVGGYSASLADSYGRLRPVLVLTRGIPGDQVISPRVAAGSFEVRKVPDRFVPVSALSDPAEAVGLVPVGALPAGSYLTASALGPPRDEKKKKRSPGRGRHAVEIAVSGAGALGGTRRVDILITSDDQRGRGRTRMVARRVPLISIGRDERAEAGPGMTKVTLGLTRRQAIRLVNAESFARRITVLPPAGG